jgi:hypothetical protein
MGGNHWESLGGSSYRAVPVDHVEYCELDLYLMGLLPAEEVSPVDLLTNVRTRVDPGDTKLAIAARKVSETVTVSADVVSVSIEQVVEAEGWRNPGVGLSARNLRQAWIYLTPDSQPLSAPELDVLEQLQARWTTFFRQATGGRWTLRT